MLNFHKGKNEIYIYVDVNHVVGYLTMRMPRCFIGKFDDSKKTRKNYFKDVDVENKVIFKFYANDLDFDGDVVVVDIIINVDNICMNINDDSFGTEKKLKDWCCNLSSERSERLNVVTCSVYKEDDEEEENDDYIPPGEKGFEIY